jgi:S1-C subfamily serine protease
VLLISEPGDQTTLYGLYEILQTLEIVPVAGPRERGRSSFTLQGENSRIVSYTEAKLVGGAIKGFTLIWPAGDEERRTRVLDLMKDSFRTTDAVLDPAVVSDSGQTVDLVSGLRVRVPVRSRSGFYVDGNGTVVTALEAVDGCARVTLDEQYEANVADRDPALGIAVLRPEATLVPMSVARLSTGSQRIGSEIAVAGYSYEGALGAPSVTFGTLSDLRGLAGETDLRRLALPALDGDIGGPVFDGTGAVMGILLPHELNGRVLPDDVSFALGADALSTALSQSGIRLQAARGTSAMPPEDLAKRAAEMTVLVSCWD